MRVIRSLSIVFTLYFLFIHLAYSEVSIDASSQEPEIHFLVDVSGSMKKTDPQNFRAKMIKMFIFLVSDKASMSLSSFASESEVLLPLSKVNTQFMNTFIKKMSKITSDGRYTDINKAIVNANKLWKSNKKIIVLMTDGAVDIGSTKLSNQSRSTLINETILKLQHEGVQVFTVGFSSAADHNLLNKISLQTNALSQTVREAKEIDEVLYKIFSAIIKANGTPIKKNKDSSRTIHVDKSINRLTLVFVKSDEINQLFLKEPKVEDKKVIDLSNKDFSTEHYLFIDIDQPTPGKWILSGPTQEVERAIILSDVKLGSDFSSGVYFINEKIRLNAFLQNEQKIIDSPFIIDKLKLKANLNNTNYPLSYTKNGLFSRTIKFDTAGNYTMTLQATSKILARELQFLLNIQPIPFSYTIKDNYIVVQLTTPQLINYQSIKISHEDQSLEIQNIDSTHSWNIHTPSLCAHDTPLNKLDLVLDGTTTSNRAIHFMLPITGDICKLSQIAHIDLSQNEFSIIPAINFQEAKLKKAEKKNRGSLDLVLYGVSILLLIILLFLSIFLIGLKYSKKINKIREQINYD